MKGFAREELFQLNTHLCFDDILLLPRYSDLESRNDPSLITHIGCVSIETPIISSPMDSITQSEMLVAMDRGGGLGILTRFIGHPNEVEEQCSQIQTARKNGAKKVGCAIGIKNRVSEHAHRLLDNGCNVICLDVAHGDHAKMYSAISAVSSFKKSYRFALMSGNVCTPEATSRFMDAGVDAIKVGIGPGAACTTRRVTGFGCPQLSAILHCADVKLRQKSNVAIICDGGLRTTGDMIKALWAGADACMSGFMFAGTSATPDIDGEKMYRGMSSRTVHQRSDVAAEGVEMRMAYRGKTDKKLLEYAQGLKSGLAMAGAENIFRLRSAKCVRVSTQTMRESDPVAGY